MRHPPDGTSGTSDSTGETAWETWSHTAFPQRSEPMPPASVARKTPRPILCGPSSIRLHVGHTGHELPAQVARMTLRVDPDDVPGRLRVDRAQRLRGDR